MTVIQKEQRKKNVSMFPYTGTDLQLNFMDDQLGSFKKNKNDRISENDKMI